MRRRWLIGVAGTAVGAAMCAGGGLFWFAGRVAATVAATPPASTTDAVVVLTGGRGRLDAGLEILAGGGAAKLFVSGVYRGVDVARLLAAGQRDPAGVECCIVLGYGADDTAGNAAETARWMRAQGYASLQLVTAAYHMPRALVEFRAALPGATIVARPVVSPNVRLERWWRWPGTTRLLASELVKYVVAGVAAAVVPDARAAGGVGAREQPP